MMYLILLWVLVKLSAPIWLIVLDIFCIIVKIFEMGFKVAKNDK